MFKHRFKAGCGPRPGYLALEADRRPLKVDGSIRTQLYTLLFAPRLPTKMNPIKYPQTYVKILQTVKTSFFMWICLHQNK